jgi:hypothetical protein
MAPYITKWHLGTVGYDRTCIIIQWSIRGMHHTSRDLYFYRASKLVYKNP